MVMMRAFWPTMRYALTSMPAAQRIKTSLVVTCGLSQEANRQRQKRKAQRDRDELGDAEQPELRVRALHERHGNSEQEHFARPRQQRHDDRDRRSAHRNTGGQEQVD